MMKIVHVVPHIDKEAAGPSYTVPRLCNALSSEKKDVLLMCLKSRVLEKHGFKLKIYSQWRLMSGFGISFSLVRSLAEQRNVVDVIHNHSLWSMINLASGIVAIGRKAKFVNSPHGALAPWAMAHHRIRKKFFWPLQRQSLVKADLIHATGYAELKDIRNLGIKTPVVVLPNGVDIPMTYEMNKVRLGSLKKLLFLGRLHPVKGVDVLIKAWKKISAQNQDWELVIAGVGDVPYENMLKNLIKELNVDRCKMIGPVYGAFKEAAYFEASLFVLPTHSENFGMAVAESLAHGCPTIVGKGAPWEGLHENECGWWIDNDINTLAETINKAMKLPQDQLQRMGLNGRAWMMREFDWSTIAFKMNCAYQWLVDGGEKPEWVEV